MKWVPLGDLIGPEPCGSLQDGSMNTECWFLDGTDWCKTVLTWGGYRPQGCGSWDIPSIPQVLQRRLSRVQYTVQQLLCRCIPPRSLASLDQGGAEQSGPLLPISRSVLTFSRCLEPAPWVAGVIGLSHDPAPLKSPHSPAKAIVCCEFQPSWQGTHLLPDSRLPSSVTNIVVSSPGTLSQPVFGPWAGV